VSVVSRNNMLLLARVEGVNVQLYQKFVIACTSYDTFTYFLYRSEAFDPLLY
jgi:hypothetical protein